MKKLLGLLLCLTMVLSLAACGGNGDGGNGSGEAGTPDNSTLVTVISGDPQSFHPDYKSDDYAWPINQNIFNRLVKLGPKDNVVLDLAESYEFSEDGKTLTFHLHDGVKWHDGEDFTSADVKWTYDTMIAESWSKSDSLANVESIECPDDLTVVMNLKTPDVSIIAKLSWYGTFILPKHLYEGQDTATCEWNMKPVGTGPYKFVSFDTGVKVTLAANEEFFGGAPKIETLIFSIIPDANTAFESFINNEVDYYVDIPAANRNDFDNNSDYIVYPSLGINRTYITVNFKDEVFGQSAVRQAMALGLDRQGIWDRTAGGTGAVASTFISPVFSDFVDETYQMPERDVEKAMQILEEAGFTKDADGFYIHAQMDTFGSSFNDIATTVAANLKEIGIDLKINNMEMGAWQDKVLVNHDFEVTILAGYQGPDVSGVTGRVASYGGTNIAQYENPELDALLELAITQSDVAERAATMSEVQRIMAEDLPLLLLVDNGYKVPVRTSLSGTPYQLPDVLASSEFSKAEFTK